MARKDEVSSELVTAAQNLELALREFEAQTAEAAEGQLRSRKHLERAAKSLEAIASAEERINAEVQKLLLAIQGAKKRKDEQSVAAAAAARRIQQRTLEFQKLMEEFGEVGKQAADISAASAEVTPTKGSMEGAGLLDRISGLGERVRALTTTAREAGFDDLTHQADSLRQQLDNVLDKAKTLSSTDSSA